MNTIDIIILLIACIPALFGLKNGFLKSIFSLAGILTGFFLATKYYDKAEVYLSFLGIDRKILSVISFTCILLITYLIFVYFSKKISGLNSFTKTLDKILGAALGLFKGLILASLFLLVTTVTFSLFSKQDIEKSKLYSGIVNIAPDTYNLIMKFFPDAKNFYEEIKKL